MRKLVFMILLLAGCASDREMIKKVDCQPARDSVIVLEADKERTLRTIRTLRDSLELVKSENEKNLKTVIALNDSLVFLSDSIEDLLLRPLMTSEQYMEIYRYESLRKFYNICKRDPSQWVNYRGWSTRVFEAKY